MKKTSCILALMFILTSSFVLAGISISEPTDIYNLGDRLHIKLDGLRGAETGNLNINLICGNETTNLIKIPARAFSFDEEQSYSIPYKILSEEDLEITNLSAIIGECQVVSSLGSNFASTKTFTISKDIFVTASLDKVSYNPDESMTIDIKAVKANGDMLNGFVEGSNATVFSKAIEEGSVTEIFSMPETIEAGIYYLTIHAYDVGQNGVLNEGSSVISFNINQVASSIIMSLSDAEITPDDDFTVGVELFDQSGIEMEGAVFVKIISPENEEIESTIHAGEFDTFSFASNSSVGIWKVSTSFNNMIEEREFEMLGSQKVEFNFEDSVLSITNVGNILYNKTISIQIGNETIELDLNIGIGEIRKFNLKAPNGEYEIVVNDGDNSISQQALLTGNVVSIDDLEEVGIFKGYSIVWIFLIVILGGVGIVFFIRYRKTKTIGGDGIVSSIVKLKNKIPGVKSHMDDSLNFTNKSPKVQGLDSKSYSHEDKSMVDLTMETAGSAESSLVLKGEKQMSAVIALSIKNYGNLEETAKKTLQKTIVEEQKNKGLVDWRGDYAFIVFSPIITKTYNNEVLAAETGMKILNSLNAYNKKFKDKIEFNLGVHVGELIASKVKSADPKLRGKTKLKYTSIGNTISLAKRISDSDNGKLIISDAIRKKLIRDLKVSKGKDINGNPTFEVSEIKNKTANAEKLKDLLKRMN